MICGRRAESMGCMIKEMRKGKSAIKVHRVRRVIALYKIGKGMDVM